MVLGDIWRVLSWGAELIGDYTTATSIDNSHNVDILFNDSLLCYTMYIDVCIHVTLQS